MTSRRRFVLGLTLGTAAVPLGAACGAPSGESAGSAPGAAGPPAKVTFFWRSNTGPYFDQAEEKARLFNERFPQYQVEVVFQVGAYTEKLTAMFAAGDPPHTFWTDQQDILPNLKAGWLEDLTPFAKGDRGYRPSDYHPASTESLTVQSKLYGLAGGAFTGGWFYNKGLYARAGAPTPAELLKGGKWTWDAFLDGASRITAAGGGQVLGTGSGTPGTRMWLNSNGIQEVDHLQFPTKSFYDTPQAAEAIEFWADTQLKHKVRDPEFGRGVQGGETTLFVDGKLGLMSRWTTGLAEFIKIKDFGWGMVPFPKGPQGKARAGDFTFWGFTAARGIRDERARRGAWEWLKLYCGREGQMIEGGKYLLSLPVDKAAADEWRKRLATTTIEYPELIFEIRDKYPYQRVMAPGRPEINKLHDDALRDVWTGGKSAREAGAEAARQVNEYLRQNPQRFAS
jgi:ABC-type glycerol-3-phosphate transport system substrate-binding protein